MEFDTAKQPLLTGRQGNGNVSKPKFPLCIRMLLSFAFEFVESSPYKKYPSLKLFTFFPFLLPFYLQKAY